jgi:ABC-type uncharacterized transport system permease subunit
MDPLIFNLTALAALLPCAILLLKRGPAPEDEVRNLAYWAVLATALAGSVAWTWALFASGWQTGIAATLWITIAATYILFALISLVSAPFARLLAVFGPYSAVLGLVATVWAHAPARGGPAKSVSAWLDLHIAVSVTTYAFVTLAAVAALGVYLQERALKARKPSRLTAMLPSVAEGEAVQFRLLAASALVLGLGLISGAVIELVAGNSIPIFSHKIFLSVLSFVVITGLLIVHRTIGMAGRRAARYLLLAYLLLTLGYPGVKFVTDIILG